MFFLGVDGGTTKTIATIGDQYGTILSAVRGKGTNWIAEEVDTPMSVVADIVKQATSEANLLPQDIRVGVFCLAGADWPEDIIRREEFLNRANLAQRIIVKNDSFGGLRAGLSRPYGIVLAAGTGMNAAVITPQGEEWAFGYYANFGGASSILEEAYDLVLRAEDGRDPPTALTGMLLAHLGFSTVETMMRASIQKKIPRSRLYSFVPQIFQAVLKGDNTAKKLVIRHGKGMAEYALALIRRYKMQQLQFEVVLAGSLFKGEGPLLIDTIRQEIIREAPEADIVRARFEPVIGSLLLAYDHGGVPSTPFLYQKLQETSPHPKLFDTIRSSEPEAVSPQEEKT